MWHFGKLLLRGWLVRLMSLAGIIGLVSLFFPHLSIPSWAPISVLILAVLIGSYDVYKRQQSEIESLKGTIEGKRTQLVILPHEGSKYYIGLEGGGDPSWGTYLWFNISIENKGSRNSTVHRYALEVGETGKAYSDVKPRPVKSILTHWAKRHRE